MLMKAASLPEPILAIVKDKHTEVPFSGEYESIQKSGTYLCRQCGLALFRTHAQFFSGCGWPSFDEEIKGTVLKQLDKDGRRYEIICSRCTAHLGHLFSGENFTKKNRRYCVNAASLDLVKDLSVMDTEEAIFAAGCFWGVEYYFERLRGVLKTEVGYTGGKESQPTYQAVCRGDSGHVEAIRVLYNPLITSYEMVVKYFFEIHDPTQANGQGPDIGKQYASVIFYYNEEQKKIAEKVTDELHHLGYSVVTQLKPVSIFWRAEKNHQAYYQQNGKLPYCHQYQKKFSPDPSS